MEWITTTDIHILFGLHRLAGPHMDAFITYFTTVINTLWLWAILAAAGLWKRRSRWVTLTIIVAVILAILVGDVAIKHFVMRIRPYLDIPGAPTLDTLKYPISYSFPLGHSFFFFAGATVLFRSCRALIAPIELATGKKAYFIGKPNPLMMRTGLKKLGVHSEEAVMIGDRMDTDIIGGVESGMETVLVMSGVSNRENIQQFSYQPHYILDRVGDLVPKKAKA